MKIITILIIIILFKLNSILCVCNSTNNDDYLSCSDFDNFNELIFNSSDSTYSTIRLYPRKRLLLDTELNLKNLNINSNEFNLYLENLSGFSMINPFALKDINNGSLYLSNSSFNFYFENMIINSSKICQDLYDNYLFVSVFDVFNAVILEKNIEYSNETCPIHFKNQIINSLKINDLDLDNMLNFYDLNQLNCTINSLELIMIEDITLDSKFLKENIFTKLKEIKILNSNLFGIQENLFQNFTFLKYLELELNNFQEFIQTIDWMLALNSDISVNLTLQTDIDNNKQNEMYIKLTDLKKQYTYSDKDFCLFKNFPHEKLVYPIIDTKLDLECSCTLLWLLQYNKQALNKSLLITDSTRNCINRPDFDNATSICRFEQTIYECDNPTTTPNSTTTTTTTTIITTTTLNETSTIHDSNENTLLIPLIVVSVLLLLLILILVFVFLRKKFFNKYSNKKSDPNFQLKSYKL
jgi:hypothetical protein